MIIIQNTAEFVVTAVTQLRTWIQSQ